MAKYFIFSLLLVLVFAAAAASQTMLLYLPMDEGQGDVVRDGSGNGNDGVLEEGPTWVNGKFGKALEFDVGSRVHIPASDSLHGDIFKDEFTLLAWINPTFAGDEWEHVWRSVDGNGDTQCTLFLNTGGFLSWRGRVAGTWGERCRTPDGSIPADVWTHIAVVGDMVDYKIYLNGEESGTAAFDEMDGAIADYYLGFDGREWDERYSGVIDEVYVFAGAMSPDEITDGMEGLITAVRPADKLATTWGHTKRD